MNIWKFPLRWTLGEQNIKAHKALSVAIQGGQLTLWALATGMDDWLRVYVAFTGSKAPDGMEFIGTVQDEEGLVWHVFSAVK